MITLRSNIPKGVMGIIMIITGVIYLIYNIKEIKEKMDVSSPFTQSVLGSAFIISILIVLGGLILVFRYFKNEY